MSATTDRAEWIGTALERYERPLTLYAARLLGDAEQARDVVQDTFLKLWQAEPDRVEDHIGQWLYTVCRNAAFDVLRKDGRMTPLEVESTVAAAPERPRDARAQVSR